MPDPKFKRVAPEATYFGLREELREFLLTLQIPGPAASCLVSHSQFPLHPGQRVSNVGVHQDMLEDSVKQIAGPHSF